MFSKSRVSSRKVVWAVVAVLVMVGSGALAFAAQARASPAPSAVGAAALTPPTASSPAAPVTTATVQPSGAGPHPGTLDIYEDTGGGTTMDPASAYNTVNAEPIWNVYETLIAYNGSSTTTVPSGFMPQLATCVPGSQECVTQFGTSLDYNNTTVLGQTQYFTFEIDAGARFYDPNTSKSWPVYPSDVVFSLARTMAFAEQPFLEAYPGWIQSQALLPKGNPNWDGGIHYPYNNTPAHIMSAILVNDSAYCPAAVEVGLKTNGCVTFNVGATGAAWPEFLQLLADPMGGGVVPCGKFTAAGAPVPGFNGTGALRGDGACKLPYGATSTSQPAFTAYLRSLKPTGWDNYEKAGGAHYPSAQPSIQWQLFGSGPYYVTEVNAAVGYFLKANPAYHAPIGCAGKTGCLPAPGDYANVVNVYWNDGDTTGLQQMAGGFADTAEVFPADFGELKSLVQTGKYGLLQNLPTLSFFFTPFELNFSLSAEAQIDSTGEINVPGTWFSNLAVREFMVNAMPYTSLISNVYTSDGIVTGEAYGGVLPHGMGAYYPTNVSWPTGNPVSAPTKVGNVTWWWKEATTPGSPWYDPSAAKCTSSHPCKFPIISLSGFSVYDDQANLWITSVKSLSGGALQPYLLDIPPTTEGVSVGLPPGQGNMPDYPYGWAPDYPDPTDNIPTMYSSAGTYTVPDAVATQLETKAYTNASACPGHTTGLNTFAALVYWANVGQVPNTCQGFAFETMNDWIPVAGADTNVTTRVLYYNLIEHIANELALYMYSNQGINVIDYASWINPASVNTNPMIGGGGDQLWSFWSYSTHVYNVTVSETGLGIGAKWSATLGTTTLSNTTAGASNSITFPGLPNGTYNYSVQFEAGFSVSPGSGTVTINGANLTQAVTYTSFSTTTATLTFREAGLISNTTWTVVVTGYGAESTPNATVTFALPESQSYTYAPQHVPGYGTPAGGSVALGTTHKAVALLYTSSTGAYSVRFEESGLTAGATWSVTLGRTGATFTQTTTTANVTFYEANGTYPIAFGLPAGYVAPASKPHVTVSGASLVVNYTFVLSFDAFNVTFTEGGLPVGVVWTWNVTIANLSVGSSTNTLGFALANGTYNWTMVSTLGYLEFPSNGTFTVSGAVVGVSVGFVVPPAQYTVTFSAASLPAGDNWTVFFNGHSTNTTSTTITFSVTNGTWTYFVVAPNGYVGTPSGGSVPVHGKGQSVTVTFAAKSTSSSPGWMYLSKLAYAAIGALVVLMLIGFALSAHYARRRKSAAPPESWTEGKPPAGGGSPPAGSPPAEGGSS